MRGIIIYKTRYGSTKQFAEWLKEETFFDLYCISDCPEDLSVYDVIVLASSIHCGSLALTKFLTKSWNTISEKTVAVMVTSGAGRKDVVHEIIRRSLPDTIYENIDIFPVGGHYVLEDMSFPDRTLIKIVAYLQNRPEVREGMLKENEDVQKDNLKELLEFIRVRL